MNPSPHLALSNPALPDSGSIISWRPKVYLGRPLVYVVRYCGTEESSVASAIRQAIVVLDCFLSSRDAGEPDELVVVYRNRLPGAVTLRIGYVVDESVARATTGEVFAGLTPAGQMIELPRTGLDQIIGSRPLAAGLSFVWQSFPKEDYRPWRKHPSAPLIAPAVPGDSAILDRPF